MEDIIAKYPMGVCKPDPKMFFYFFCIPTKLYPSDLLYSVISTELILEIFF
jgi:hypothetical protein